MHDRVEVVAGYLLSDLHLVLIKDRSEYQWVIALVLYLQLHVLLFYRYTVHVCTLEKGRDI